MEAEFQSGNMRRKTGKENDYISRETGGGTPRCGPRCGAADFQVEIPPPIMDSFRKMGEILRCTTVAKSCEVGEGGVLFAVGFVDQHRAARTAAPSVGSVMAVVSNSAPDFMLEMKSR